MKLPSFFKRKPAFQDYTKWTGHVRAVLTDEHGNIKQVQEFPNLVVTAGLAFITSRMIGTSLNVMSHMAVGTTNTAAATGQTTLVAELARASLSGAVQGTVTLTNDSVIYTAVFGAGVGTGTLVEAGIFNNSSGGTMLCRTVFSSVTKGSTDTLTLTWTVTGS